MQIDTDNFLHRFGLRILIGALSLIGTTIGGFYHYVDSRISVTEQSISGVSKDVSDIHSDTSRIEAKVDTVITLLRKRN